ncbi:inactive TPR repeat-containing thioredoxin TTL3-like [Malania oleifera]|uniref:inactive TPR repeat-containing thioredoxin TTL3-like n=1 Tax=Malania oleifera TaxID=397392 RepID=UPI0025ADA2D9|nr:inactive TPR repeat-containing thioredoxin TTL3-like [Malania oleifera]
MTTVESELGCGLMGGFFWPRKTSVRSLPTDGKKNIPSKVHHNSHMAEPLTPKQEEKHITKPALVSPRLSASLVQKQASRTSDATRSSTSSSNSLKLLQALDSAHGRRLHKEPAVFSGDSTRMLTDSQLGSNGSRTTVRAPSGNVVLLGQMGNLRKQGNGDLSSSNFPSGNGKHTSDSVLGNIVRKPREGNQKCGNEFRGLMNRLDPEVLKSMGNEKYKQGRFEEALALYDRAIALDSNNASYRSNKSAALTGLGRLVGAVLECREAIQIEPSYHRAHHRLATLYLRLGEAERALHHYKLSEPKAGIKDIAHAQALKTHLSRCNQARKLREWNTLIKETQCAITSGADSSPLVFAMQAEALLKLHRHQEAYSAFPRGHDFDIDSCMQLFGLTATAYLLIIQAQVEMAIGRFEDAVSMAQCAIQLDSSSDEVSTVLRTVRAVASARLMGNQLFKASKFFEACVAYSEGLEHDPYNSVLLCNRAACRCKLSQFEKGIEDCSVALAVRPSYGKARLRRANCNAKLQRWEASIQDYEMLMRESPGDEEVGRALFEAQVQLKMQRGEDVKDMKFGSNLVCISSNERFRYFITSPGMSVVLFCKKTCHKQVVQLMEQVCKKFPTLNFLKVEVEDHPYIAKSEGVGSIPAFKIYKNGSRVKEIPGSNLNMLESSLRLYSN